MVDLWYKNAVVYCLDVETYVDSNGDGIGDFAGLTHRLDHVSGLGVNCIWLMPFFPTPNRDDGYDVIDYFDVDRRLGNPGEFVNFTREARERGIRVIIDLVVNHTSSEHPWFQMGRSDPASPYRSYYIWADEPPEDADDGVIFPGHQESTWTYDEEAGQYYHHRFYEHQPDLNIGNPAVQEQIEHIMGYWIELGVSGFRLDAAPFLVEIRGTGSPNRDDRFGYLNEMRTFLQWRQGDAIMLAEANVKREEILEYFGDGYRMHMVFGFLINQKTFLSLARGDARPLAHMLRELPRIPRTGQWAMFLRNHDELDLGRLSDKERQEVFDAFAPDEEMRLYDRGIRRRLATMLDGDLDRLKLAYALLFSLPGTPVIYYGDEIGMGDDLDLPERDGLRTPMQWSDEKNAGFSTAPADRLVRPIVQEGAFGYEHVNVADSGRNPDSLMNAVEKMIRTRRGTPEFGWGDFRIIETDVEEVLVHRCDWRGNTIVAIHNMGDAPREVTIEVDEYEALDEWTDILEDRDYPRLDAAERKIPVGEYGYRWLRLHGTRR
jgi:maltose alpha-D-glucosyltransferase/alpha-amylase